MPDANKHAFFEVLCLGMIAGMRSVAAPALVSDHLAHERSNDALEPPFSILASRKTANVLKALAVCEMISDKLPATPARISAAPLAARAISGAICGAAICKAERESPGLGAIIGSAAAIGSSFLFYNLRKNVGVSLPIPDPALGLIEDGIAVTTGRAVLQRGWEPDI
jgi:uncharacterized membrane protein